MLRNPLINLSELILLLSLCKLCDLFINLYNQIRCSPANSIKRCLKLRNLFIRGPACHIRKRILCSINSIMLAYNISYRFRFTFLLISGLLITVSIHCFLVVKRCMTGLMKCSFYSLCFAHTLLNSNSIFLYLEIPLSSGFNILKGNWNRTGLLYCLHKSCISLYRSGKFIYTKPWHRLTFRLRDIKCTYRLKSIYLNLYYFLHRFTIFIKYRLSISPKLILFSLHLI